jgi:hypothetical protein
MDENSNRFQELLPFYLNDRLNEADHAWMLQYLAQNPQTEAELHFEQSLKAALRAELPETAQNQGLDAMMSRIRSDLASAKDENLKSESRSFIDSCLNAISAFFHNPGWAVAVTLLILQTGFIGLLMNNRTAPLLPTYSQWRSVGETPAYKGAVLQITFKSSATEAEIRLLMVKIHGVFLGGPGQLGNYIVRVAPEQLEAAKKQVQDSAIIEAVQVLPEMPTEP